VMCGPGGNQTRESYVYTPASPGAAIQCPPKFEWQVCNSWMCYITIPGFGYWYWQLCPSKSTNFTWTIGSPDRNIDMFLFSGDWNWAAYRKDVNRRSKPRNYGYDPISAAYNTQNGIGWANLTGGQCYYMVADYTWVGAANNNGNNDWNPINVWYLLLGNPDSATGTWGTGQFSAASPLSVSGGLLFLLALLSYLVSN